MRTGHVTFDFIVSFSLLLNRLSRTFEVVITLYAVYAVAQNINF